jgi:hypothetical protein
MEVNSTAFLHQVNKMLNLNYELANSAVKRNERRIKKFSSDGWKPDAEVSGLQNIAAELLNDAENLQMN